MCTRDIKKTPKTSSSDPKLLWQLRKIQENDKNSPNGWWHFRFDVIILLNGEPPFSLIRVVTWETYRFYDLWFLPTSQELSAWSLLQCTLLSIFRPPLPKTPYIPAYVPNFLWLSFLYGPFKPIKDAVYCGESIDWLGSPRKRKGSSRQMVPPGLLKDIIQLGIDW